MRKEAASKKQKTDRDFAGLTALTGEKDRQAAEAAAQQMVDDYEAAHPADIPRLWSAVNKATKTSLKKVYDSGLLSKLTRLWSFSGLATIVRITLMYSYTNSKPNFHLS